MSYKRKGAVPSASSIIDGMKKVKAVGKRTTTADELVAKISASILDLSEVERILGDLIADEQGVWTFDEFAVLTDASPIVELLYNSAFIRAAARLGFVFFVGPDQRVRRSAVGANGGKIIPKAKANSTGKANKDYYVKPPWYEDLARFVDEDAPTLLIGPPGVGKSEACERLFVERDQPLHIISCTPAMTADDLEGRIELRNEGGVVVTRFEKGEMPLASELGQAVLLDDADAIPAHAAFGVFRLLAGQDMRILRMGGDGRVARHAGFRVVGTQNTEGRGDDRGLHHGRSYQDEAFLDRWENVIRVAYLPKDVESDILVNRTGVSAKDADRIVDAADLLRRALAEDTIMFSVSMRRTLAAAKNFVRGYSAVHSWSYAVVNRATREDAKAMVEILGRVYGSTWEKPRRKKTPRRRK